MQYIPIPITAISPGRISHYCQRSSSSRRSRNPYRDKIVLTPEQKAWETAHKKKKRIHAAVHLLHDSAAPKRVFSRATRSHFFFKLTFVTLTLPGIQKHDDSYIHNRIFKDFIRAWKRKEPNLLYIYRAETQANGNLHYHLVSNAFIHWKDLRNMWNYYCKRHGYDKHEDANSTDVHSLKNVSNPAAYIAKYITKQDKSRRKTDIKEWDCSYALKRWKPVVIEMPSSRINHECDWLSKTFSKVKNYDFASVQKLRYEWLSANMQLRQLYESILQEVKQINLSVKKDNLII